MNYAESSFISSTFWTERIGPTAALKTLEVMNKQNSWDIITNKGKNVGLGWRNLGQKYDLPLNISGLPSMISFNIDSNHWLKYKTYITQEMLKKGILATTIIFVCTEHTPALVDQYFEALNPIFALIKECESGRSVDDLLEGPVCHAGFKRLN